MADFKAHLRKQLGFLKRSCASWDAGHQDEGIRIAVIARVLLHQTDKSTSLLHHLGAPGLRLMSTVRQLPISKIIHFMGMGMVQTKIATGSHTVSYIPNLGNGPTKPYPLSANEWWNQIVIKLGSHVLSRGAIALAAANKDGGAHVDAKLTAEYKALAADGMVDALYSLIGVPFPTPIEGAHLVCMRQMGYELLNSPELLKLASSE